MATLLDNYFAELKEDKQYFQLRIAATGAEIAKIAKCTRGDGALDQDTATLQRLQRLQAEKARLTERLESKKRVVVSFTRVVRAKEYKLAFWAGPWC